jgi:hypothetical protein
VCLRRWLLDKIDGGYYIKARQVQQSNISKAPPHIREIWDWLILHANYSDQDSGGRTIERGSLFTSYEEILEGLAWYIGFRKCKYTKHQCETAMKYLVKHGMVTTARTTRGTIVTVCNYNRFQDPSNYENHNETGTRTGQNRDDKERRFKEGKKEKKEPKAFSSNSNEFRLAKLLFRLIRKNNPDSKEPNLQKWAETFDLTIRVDKRKVEALEKVIRWCQQDDFWYKNILSAAAIRRQYDKLILKMKETPTTSKFETLNEERPYHQLVDLNFKD